MDKKVLIKKMLDNIQGTSFTIKFSAYEGGACGDGWSGTGSFYLEKSEILYLLKKKCNHEEVFDGCELKTIDLECALLEKAVILANPDSDYSEDDEDDSWSYGYRGEEVIENFLNAYSSIISGIYSGQIDENNLDSYLVYFDNKDNFEYEIEDFVSVS